ncbi:MAG: hypothetical protein NTV32_08175 [Gammaproteobacteria bacterium]|nr:hypothetical protein [Gammaproteobacteria bacterium]
MSNHQLTTSLATLSLQISSIQKMMPIFIEIYQDALAGKEAKAHFTPRQLELFAKIGHDMEIQVEKIKADLRDLQAK